MAAIRIDISNVKSTLSNMKEMRININNTKNQFQSNAKGIDDKIKKKVIRNNVSIVSSINSINSKLDSIDTMIKDIENTIRFATDKYDEAEDRINKKLVKEYLNNISANNNHFNTNKDGNDFISKSINKAMSVVDFLDDWSSKITDFISASTAVFNALVTAIIPYAKNLKIKFQNGTYRVLGNIDTVRELGLARWYKSSTVQSKPNVDKIFKNIQSYEKIDNLSNKSLKYMDEFGDKLNILGGVLVGVNEFFVENKGKQIGERITDTTIEVGVFAFKAAAGAAIGNSIGTWVGGIAGSLLGGPAGTVLGVAIGSAIGTGVGIAATWVVDKIIDEAINVDLNKDGKGAKDTIKDFIGNAANNASEFLFDTGRQISGNGVSRINKPISSFA